MSHAGHASSAAARPRTRITFATRNPGAWRSKSAMSSPSPYAPSITPRTTPRAMKGVGGNSTKSTHWWLPAHCGARVACPRPPPLNAPKAKALHPEAIKKPRRNNHETPPAPEAEAHTGGQPGAPTQERGALGINSFSHKQVDDWTCCHRSNHWKPGSESNKP